MNKLENRLVEGKPGQPIEILLEAETSLFKQDRDGLWYLCHIELCTHVYGGK